MTKIIVQQEITTLFQAAGQAHHQAYLETDGVDPDWPRYYAKRLVEWYL